MDAAAAGLVGAFGGATIGFVGTLAVNAAQRREARRDEKRRAFAGYLGALYPVITELREMPANKEPDGLAKMLDRLSGEQAAWVRTRKGLIAMSPHAFGRMDRLSAAFARVQLLDLSTEVMEVVETANDYAVELGEERSTELIARWPMIHKDLLDAGAQLNQAHRWRLRLTGRW
jgi:hypothetical protein